MLRCEFFSLDKTGGALGSITSRCSGKEPAHLGEGRPDTRERWKSNLEVHKKILGHETRKRDYQLALEVECGAPSGSRITFQNYSFRKRDNMVSTSQASVFAS